MKRIVISISLFWIASNLFAGAPVSVTGDTKQEVLLAINNLTAAIHRVKTVKDNMILQQEYTNIFVNIEKASIPDQDLLPIYDNLRKVFTQQKVLDKYKKQIESIQDKSITDMVYAQLSSNGATRMAVNISKHNSDPQTAAITAIALGTAVGLTASYDYIRNGVKKDYIDRNIWKTEDKVIEALGDAESKLFVQSTILLQRHKIAAGKDLNENDLQTYVEILEDGNAAERLQRLKSIESDSFRNYPPYWYYLATTALEINDKRLAYEAFEKYEKVWRPLSREDQMYASALMNKVVLLDKEKDRDEMLRHLESIKKYSGQDWQKKLFVGMCYGSLGKYDEAIKLYKDNIANNKNVSLHKRLIGEIYASTKDEKHLPPVIFDMIQDTNVRAQDVVYAIKNASSDNVKDTSARALLKGFDVGLKEAKVYGADDIQLELPTKWILNDLADTKVQLLFKGKEYEAKEYSVGKERIAYGFITAVKNIGKEITDNKRVPVTIVIQHPSLTAKVFGDLYMDCSPDKGYVEKGKKYMLKGRDKVRRWFPRSDKYLKDIGSDKSNLNCVPAYDINYKETLENMLNS